VKIVEALKFGLFVMVKEHISAICPVCKSESSLCFRPSGHAVFGKEWHMPREDATALINMDHCVGCADWVKSRNLVASNG
jgi:hypothetical protein